MVTPTQPGPEVPARASEGGYTLVVLAIAVTVMSILVAAALPMWSQVIQRDKEEELIFRGWQYAEAIRVFQQRQGRLPVRLEELMEVKPRSIRRLWKDPMTKDGEWGLVFQGVGALPGQGGGRELGGGRGAGGEDRNGRASGNTPTRGPNGKVVTTGPIVGVHSLSKDESIKVLFGEGEYDKWTFTVQRLTAPPGSLVNHGKTPPIGGAVAGGPLQARAAETIPRPRWLGRPFQKGLFPAGGTLPAGGLGKQPGSEGPEGRRRPRRGGRGPGG